MWYIQRFLCRPRAARVRAGCAAPGTTMQCNERVIQTFENFNKSGFDDDPQPKTSNPYPGTPNLGAKQLGKDKDIAPAPREAHPLQVPGSRI